MTSRERIRKLLNHEKTDKIPVDFGGNVVTGIHVSALDNLIKRLVKKIGLKPRTVKAFEPMMMCG